MKKTQIIWIVAIVALVAIIGFLIYGYVRNLAGNTQNPIVTMEVADYGTIKIEV